MEIPGKANHGTALSRAPGLGLVGCGSGRPSRGGLLPFFWMAAAGARRVVVGRARSVGRWLASSPSVGVHVLDREPGRFSETESPGTGLPPPASSG
jgi:hypothetical protein